MIFSPKTRLREGVKEDLLLRGAFGAVAGAAALAIVLIPAEERKEKVRAR